MNLQATRILEIAAGTVVVAGVTAVGAWMVFRKRPSPEEIEVARRAELTTSGRLVDGTLLDVRELPVDDGRTLNMLLYAYRIGGVDYECSQDVTNLAEVVDVTGVRAGFPCSVRYQPGNPQNSIVVAEQWSGIRATLPLFPLYDGRNRLDARYTR
jgi:hypothetical protein